MIRKLLIATLSATLLSPLANAADYIVDYSGAHASVNFKIQHLGYSWLTGRFDKFGGKFSYDSADISASDIYVEVDVASINSNHAERDKHLRGNDFLDTAKFTTATFQSTEINDLGEGEIEVIGQLSLRGISKEITIYAEKIGEGKDPWGGYRAGFSGTTELTLKDFGIPTNLGPASTSVELELHIEGVRQ